MGQTVVLWCRMTIDFHDSKQCHSSFNKHGGSDAQVFGDVSITGDYGNIIHLETLDSLVYKL